MSEDDNGSGYLPAKHRDDLGQPVYATAPVTNSAPIIPKDAVTKLLEGLQRTKPRDRKG